MVEDIKWTEFFVGKLEIKKLFETPRSTLEDIIKMNLMKIGCECGLNSSISAQGPMAGFCEHSNESKGFLKGENFVPSIY
jgi:hypothetical protein